MTRILLPGSNKASQTRRGNAFLGKMPFGTGQSARADSGDAQTTALISRRNAMRRAWRKTPIGSKGKL